MELLTNIEGKWSWGDHGEVTLNQYVVDFLRKGKEFCSTCGVVQGDLGARCRKNTAMCNTNQLSFSKGHFGHTISHGAAPTRIKVFKCFIERLAFLDRTRGRVVIPPGKCAKGLPTHDANCRSDLGGAEWLRIL